MGNIELFLFLTKVKGHSALYRFTRYDFLGRQNTGNPSSATFLDELEFVANRLINDAVVKNIENIGEAGNNLIKRFSYFSRLAGDITTFVRAYEMRNFVVHGYFHVDYTLVWKTYSGSSTRFS